MTKVLESKIKVRFQDCDPFNHLNNSKYLDYFVNAREDHLLQHYNLDVFSQIGSLGKRWVISGHQIAYIKPAIQNEEVIIVSQLLDFSSSALKVEMQMFDKTKTSLKAVLWTKFAYYDIKNQRKAEHSEELKDLFTKIVNPAENLSFEKRCIQIINNLKKNICRL